MSWEQAWQEGRTPWDRGHAAPELQRLVAEGALPEGPTLVTGAGSGYDALCLASAKRPVTALDLSSTAKEAFLEVAESSSGKQEQVTYIVADFFNWQPPSPFELIWDYTFLCALPLEQRSAWAERVHALLAPQGILLTLLFPVDAARDPHEGPPFALDLDAVSQLLEPYFSCEFMIPARESVASRQGKEWLAKWQKREKNASR